MSTTSESFLVGLIGTGITRSLTPPMHEAEARHHGLHYLYRPVDLEVIGRPGRDIGALLRAGRDLGFNAFNVTHPCKQLVMDHLDHVDDDAAAIGAVNTVLVRDGTFIGHNTDRSGFASGLAAGLPGVSRDHVLQIGAGGAGSAVAAALVTSGTGSLSLFDTDPARAEARALFLATAFPHASVSAVTPEQLPTLIRGADGIVNATPVGMHGHPGTPFDTGLLGSHQWVADVVYLPVETELVSTARATGCRVLDGGYMAVGQAVDAFRLITGAEPDHERMRAHFLSLLSSARTL